MRSLALGVLLVLAVGCGPTDADVRFDQDLGVYVRLVPVRERMDVAEIASHDLLGSSLLEITGRKAGRIK